MSDLQIGAQVLIVAVCVPALCIQWRARLGTVFGLIIAARSR